VSRPAGSPESNGNDGIASVACAPQNYCVAVGNWEGKFTGQFPYAVTWSKGTWSRTLNLRYDGLRGTGLLSCPSAGDCVVIGGQSALSENRGTWGKAVTLNTSRLGGAAPETDTLACTSAGNCVAGGMYQTSADGYYAAQPFVVSERNGVWGPAENLPGAANPNTMNGTVASVSCRASRSIRHRRG
jgi:hypothetical protein